SLGLRQIGCNELTRSSGHRELRTVTRSATAASAPTRICQWTGKALYPAARHGMQFERSLCWQSHSRLGRSCARSRCSLNASANSGRPLPMVLVAPQSSLVSYSLQPCPANSRFRGAPAVCGLIAMAVFAAYKAKYWEDVSRTALGWQTADLRRTQSSL